MTLTTCHLSVSLDGFVAGPDQSLDHPLGGRRHRACTSGTSTPTSRGHEADIAARATSCCEPSGAYVMGRNMFGPIRGEWDGDWRGWWGEDPPYHAPVFVLTHHARDADRDGRRHDVPLRHRRVRRRARARAKQAAGDLDVDIAGGASTVRQALAAGALDELNLDIVPVLLGCGRAAVRRGRRPGAPAARGDGLPARHARALPGRPLTQLSARCRSAPGRAPRPASARGPA